MAEKEPLRCAEDGCALPFAYIENGVMVVTSSHHGRKHINVITLEEIQRRLGKEPRSNS